MGARAARDVHDGGAAVRVRNGAGGLLPPFAHGSRAHGVHGRAERNRGVRGGGVQQSGEALDQAAEIHGRQHLRRARREEAEAGNGTLHPGGRRPDPVADEAALRWPGLGHVREKPGPFLREIRRSQALLRGRDGLQLLASRAQDPERQVRERESQE